MSPYPQFNVLSVVPQTVNLALYAGDGAAFKIATSLNDGTPFTLQDGEYKSQIRENFGDGQAVLEFHLDLDYVSSGVVVLSLTGEQTASLVYDKKFNGFWDLQFKPTNGEPMTLIRGKVTCDPDVSH